jgi:hypothetical protein
MIPYAPDEWCACGRHFIPRGPEARMWADRQRAEELRQLLTRQAKAIADAIDRQIILSLSSKGRI